MTNNIMNNNPQISRDALYLVTDIWRKHATVSGFPAYEYLTKKMGHVGHHEYLSSLSCAVQNSVSGIDRDPATASQRGMEALYGCELMTQIHSLSDLSDEDCLAISHSLPFSFIKTEKKINLSKK